MSTKLDKKTSDLAAERKIASHKILLENDEMIVTHWVFKPGEQTGWHLHEMDYMPIQLSEGKLMFEFPDGSTKRNRLCSKNRLDYQGSIRTQRNKCE